MDAVDVLMEARGYIEKGWCQGALWKGALSGPAVAWCPIGAIAEAQRGHDFADPDSIPYPAIRAMRLLSRAVGQHVPGWNDAPGRTKEEVLEAIDRAIALGVEEEPL